MTGARRDELEAEVVRLRAAFATREADLYRVSVGQYGPIEVTAESLAASGGTLDLRIGL